MKSSHKSTMISRQAVCLAAATVALAFAGTQAHAIVIDVPQTWIEFDTELRSLNLTGGPFPMPLASDPGNALGDSIEGYGFVNSRVTITLSSQRGTGPGSRSFGKAIASTGEGPALTTLNGSGLPPIDPNALNGRPFFVDSFFDVFFDITVTDVDDRSGRNFAGMPHGAIVFLHDNGPANMQSFYQAIFDKNAPNFGLVPPPEVSPYVGHFDIEVPLGGDINGNGINDKIKFTLAAHSVGDENRTFITLPDGTVLDQFDSAAYLAGAVVDENTDPPFTIGSIDPVTGLPMPGTFGGPTTASSRLLNPLQVPEPATLVLLGLGLAGMGFSCRKKA